MGITKAFQLEEREHEECVEAIRGVVLQVLEGTTVLFPVELFAAIRREIDALEQLTRRAAAMTKPFDLAACIRAIPVTEDVLRGLRCVETLLKHQDAVAAMGRDARRVRFALMEFLDNSAYRLDFCIDHLRNRPAPLPDDKAAIASTQLNGDCK